MRFWLGAGACALGTVAILGACGDDDSSGGPGADAGSDGAPPIVRAPWGLDTRPSNTTCLAPARPPSTTGVKLERVFANLSFNQPVHFMQAPGDPNRFFVVELPGRVKAVTGGATPQSADFVDLTDRVVQQGEGGLLGLAFHPDWANNKTAFVSYTRAPLDNMNPIASTVTRIQSGDNGVTLDKATESTVIAPFDQPYDNHDGGNIAFGADGMLYIGFGDGGSGGDPKNYGQDINVLFGKILRVDVGTQPYTIPAGNPFAGGGGAPEIFAWGFRNPWRFSFDRSTGELWVGDVGQNQYEEVDLVKVGGNYGWKVREGMHCYNAATCNSQGMIDPVVEYDHTEGNSITGGYVYRGSAIPSLVGSYIYGDYGSGKIWRIVYDGAGVARSELLVDTGQGILLSSFGEDAAGELYAIDIGGGRIFKLVADGNPPPDTFPDKLSKTGCVDPANPQLPASGLIPYGVESPLWSDGAIKERYLALPDGAQIHILPDGDFDFPIGSVLVKHFRIGEQLVETRLFIRHDDGEWGGYSYEWDDAQTDATLLPSSKARRVGNQTWHYPSRAECMRCHSTAAGRSLGPEVLQLNGDFVYPTRRLSNQLATFEHIGLFDAPLPQGSPLPKLSDPGGQDPVEARAKSYLHSNCSFCHRPGGLGRGPMDMLFSTPVGGMQSCDAQPQNGDLGLTDARIIAPGAPERSVLVARMQATDAHRMPPLGTTMVDPTGTGAVSDWVRQLATCPPAIPTDAGP